MKIFNLKVKLVTFWLLITSSVAFINSCSLPPNNSSPNNSGNESSKPNHKNQRTDGIGNVNIEGQKESQETTNDNSKHIENNGNENTVIDGTGNTTTIQRRTNVPLVDNKLCTFDGAKVNDVASGRCVEDKKIK